MWHDYDIWHWFRQVTAPCNVARGSGIVTVNSSRGSTLQCDTWLWDDMPLNSPKRPPYWNWRISPILDFRGPIMGFLKSPCATSYRSSIYTIALNCLVFEKRFFFAFWWQTDRQTDRQTNRQTDEQMDSTDALSRFRCREQRLKNVQFFAERVCVTFG